MIRWFLAKFGYVKTDWGLSSGRFYVVIDRHEFDDTMINIRDLIQALKDSTK